MDKFSHMVNLFQGDYALYRRKKNFYGRENVGKRWNFNVFGALFGQTPF